MSIFIGGAWAYANGSLHLGHISSLLPGDILARYYRMKGEKVLYVSGSDCNGTPITIRAKQEGLTTKEIADRYHDEFVTSFSKLGFSYDFYTRTDTEHHHKIVQAIFLELLENELIYKKEIEQTYCETCRQFLPDRYVVGTCPECHQHARGDQCDHCSTILDPIDLLDKKCSICKGSPKTKLTEHFYFALSKLQCVLEDYLEASKSNWRDNAVSLTRRYLNEGLQDRAASRDLSVGVSVPVTGYEGKKIYVWIEAVAGYYSASKLWASENNEDSGTFWSENTLSYYVHGKDNIPFHSIIWAGILAGLEMKPLPTHIVSNEYLTLEKKKLSTSKNWAVWVPDILERYNPDSIRYFLTINAPENRDADFSWREFIYSHNSELLGAYGNLVNRTFKFITKYYNGTVPNAKLLSAHENEVDILYQTVGDLIEKTYFKKGLEEIFQLVRYGNKYFDEQQPWRQIKLDRVACDKTIANCVFIITNLAHLLSPFLPFSSEKVKQMLQVKSTTWGTIYTHPSKLENIEPLFERINLKQVELELEKLKQESDY
ncbi:methionine--tRNA ligase [Sutcliffiella halmapala]|uniref:methionine--tRNA ligase n=1 Tax=Sutcliffiella halmapala TaxID=79882 RepID=UPI000994E496|nr:methionine--tRNA ligase [Sutcliffiella halmapala]